MYVSYARRQGMSPMSGDRQVSYAIYIYMYIYKYIYIYIRNPSGGARPDIYKYIHKYMSCPIVWSMLMKMIHAWSFWSLRGPWEVHGGAWGSLGSPWGGLWGSWGDPGEEEKRRRPGMVLGAPWGGFGGMGRSSGQSWEVRMLLFRRC